MSGETSLFVLDSYALLAFLEGEAGMERVREVLIDAEGGGSEVYLSWINLGEVLYITERERGLQQARETLAIIHSLPVQLLEVTCQAVLDAAHIKASHRLAYADAFAAAAALEKGAGVLTGDPEFESVAAIVRIEWLDK